MQSRNWPGEDLLRDVGGLLVDMILWLANFSLWRHPCRSIFHPPLRSGSGECQCATLGSAVVGGIELRRELDALAERILEKVDGRREEVVAKCHTSHAGFCLRPKLGDCESVYRHGVFLIIRKLLVEAYETPSWAQIFPYL